MSSIQDKISTLNEMLSHESTSFELSQKMQFEWLQTILAQIDFYSKDEKKSQPSICSTAKVTNAAEIVPKRSMPSEKVETQSNNYDLSPKKRTSNGKKKPNHKNLSPTTSFSRGSQKVVSPITKQSSQIKINNKDLHPPEPKPNEQLQISSNRCATSPCFSTSNSIKFVEEDSMLMDSSSMMSSEAHVEEDESEDPVPFTVSGSMRELTQSASSFREKWIEMLHQKKAATNIPKKPFKFAFDDIDEAMPENYQISDDSDRENDDEDDMEMYERNPVEIHGKTIPIWARGDQLLKQLKRQQRIDPDSIFLGFTADCPLTELFGTNKARWVNRQDSGWYENDIATEEEVSKFKAALGLQ